MRKNSIRVMVALVMAFFGATSLMWEPVSASGGRGKFNSICDDPALAGDDACKTVNDDRNLMKVAQDIINVVLSLVGVIAVIVIVVAGQRIVTSAGDPSKLKMAKDMLTWGIVGVIVALMAYAIVNFVIVAVTTS